MKLDRGKKGDVVDSRTKLTRNTEKHKVSPPGVVHDLQLLKVPDHDGVHDLGDVVLVVRVPDVVDAHPHAKEGILGRPGGCLPGRDAVTKLGDLVDEAEHVGRKGHDQVGVGGGAAVGKVVDQEERLVVRGDERAEPVGAAAGSVAREGRVAEGVGGVGEEGRVGDGAVEVGLGVGVTADVRIRMVMVLGVFGSR